MLSSDNNDDGGEIIAATILTFRSKSKLTKPQIRHEIVRKARMYMGHGDELVPRRLRLQTSSG